jgi:chemotaxis protein MotB
MAGPNKKPIIVVKRIKKVAGGHHGGAWKIAYADFVTAMMAFFLLMWLLSNADENKLKGIEEYFKQPLKLTILEIGQTIGDSSSVIKGGGTDLTRKEAQMNRSNDDTRTSVEVYKKELMPLAQNLAAESEAVDQQRLEQLKKQLDSLLQNNERLAPYSKQLNIDITTEGLRIQIVDEKNRPMFPLGSSQLQSYVKVILKELVPAINTLTNPITISGHTDSIPYPRGNKSYSNWELSADRANSARRSLVESGLEESRIMKVVGLSSAILQDDKDPQNPINRRINIIVMNKKAIEFAKNEVNSKEVTSIPFGKR